MKIPNADKRKRNARSPRQNPNNPNYVLLREKMERKRTARNIKRAKAGKNPLANPLTMVLGEEQKQAYSKGYLLLMDGNKRVEVPLSLKTKLGYSEAGITFNAKLQGVYKLQDGKLAVLRTGQLGGKPVLTYYILEGKTEKMVWGFFDRLNDIAHMCLEDPKLAGRGLGVKASIKAEKEYRTLGGKQPIFVQNHLFPIFEKMHYMHNPASKNYMRKQGKVYAAENMQVNHVIEAIDPVSGKVKMFPFAQKK